MKLKADGRPASRIVGMGSSVPEQILTNADLEKMVDTSDEWITARTGIKERHVSPVGVPSSDYSAKAAQQALDEAGVTADKLDLLLVGTVTGDSLFPASAVNVQSKIGAKNATCLDLSAACSGFLYSLHFADMAIRTGQAKYVLAIGVEILTCMTDWSDRATCVLFGDGAGAALVTATDEQSGDRGILSSYIGTNGDLMELLYCPGGGSIIPPKQRNPVQDYTVKMAGNEVFKHAVKTMHRASNTALELAGMQSSELDMVVPHQANIRIIDGLAKKLQMPKEKVFVNIHKYGNTSAASIPIALVEARQEGKIREGSNVLCVAFGGGFTWGSAIVRF